MLYFLYLGFLSQINVVGEPCHGLVCRKRDLVAARREPTQTPSCWLGRLERLGPAPSSARKVGKGGSLRPLLQTCLYTPLLFVPSTPSPEPLRRHEYT